MALQRRIVFRKHVGLVNVSVRSNPELFEQEARLETESAKAQAIKTGHRVAAGDQGILVSKPNLDTPGSGEVLAVNLLPGAPPESRRIAFNLNLRCATAMSPCTELCQLTPSAWKLYSRISEVQRMVGS